MRAVRPLAALLAAVLAGALSAPAQASPTQESTFQDDNRLIYSPPERVRATLDELAGLGADRVRITVVWAVVAPDPKSRSRPAFDAADPASYPRSAWDRFDFVIREAAARGLSVNLNLTAPAPLWATAPPPREDIADTYDPTPSEFAAFATAVGRRYSGRYPGVPRVDYWSIWNEPNQSGWLTPQFADIGGGRFVEAAPRIYRALADAAYAGLRASGHGEDTILIGETAPKGDASRGVKRRMKALVFVRALYCLDGQLRPLTGAAAAELGCEAPGDFAARHPVLFAATGFAHHPYELLLAPSSRQSDPDYVTLQSLGRLERTLDTAFAAHGVDRRLPLYLTEYGYQTDPPDELTGVSFGRQAAYLNESEYLAYRNPRVRTLSQFLLVDDAEPIGLTFQSGLRLLDGSAKPALDAYRLPVWVPRRSVRHGRTITVWGLVRVAPNGRPAAARVELRPSGAKRWRRLATARTNERGYLVKRVRLKRSGRLRLAYDRPAGAGRIYSREVGVRVKQPRRARR